jgi:hypothetical protein
MHGDPMKDFDMREDETLRLEARITAALEQAPRVVAPEDFAARVAARVPVRSTLSAPALQGARFGWAAAVVSLVVLLAAMLWLAPRATPHAVYWIALEWLMCAQFCAVAIWVGGWRSRAE